MPLDIRDAVRIDLLSTTVEEGVPGIFLSASIVFPSLPFFLFFFLVNAVSLKVNYSLLTSNINHVINLPIERLNDHFSAQLFVSIFVHF